MVAQRTLTPYVEVRILLPLPKRSKCQPVLASFLFPFKRIRTCEGFGVWKMCRRQVFIGVISHAFPPFCFPLPFSPKRFPTPFLRRVPNRGPRKTCFVGRGAAAERVSFRHLAEANDTQLAVTRHAPRNFGTFCPEVRLLVVLPQPGYPFSDGHSVFKVLSIDELP